MDFLLIGEVKKIENFETKFIQLLYIQLFRFLF